LAPTESSFSNNFGLICAEGRCEKLISPPIIMNNILKVLYLYGHKKNNNTIHLTLGGLGDTALSDLLEGKNTKDFKIKIKIMQEHLSN
jgi:hypothetical protein